MCPAMAEPQQASGTKTLKQLFEAEPDRLSRFTFDVAGVREAIVAGAREGRVVDGSRLTVFQRLDTEGWLLAVTVDAAPYGGF